MSSIWGLNNKTEAKWQELTETDYFSYHFNTFKNIMISMFKYENLPESCDSYFIENALFNYGRVAFHKDITTGEIYNWYVNGQGEVNRYGYYTNYTLTTDAGVFIKNNVKIDDVIVGYNNLMRTSTNSLLFQPCVRLADMEMTMDTNLFAQKMPIIIEADVYNENSIKTMFNQFKRNAKAIITRKKGHNDMLDGNMKVHKTEAPFIADKILMLKRDITNDILTRIGVNNVDLEKKERLVTSEADSNLMEIMAHAYSLLDARKEMIDKVNKKYGLNISVDYRDKNKFANLLYEDVNEEIESDGDLNE